MLFGSIIYEFYFVGVFFSYSGTMSVNKKELNHLKFNYSEETFSRFREKCFFGPSVTFKQCHFTRRFIFLSVSEAMFYDLFYRLF